MKSTKNINIVIIYSLFIALFLSGCVSTSRHLKEMAEKDLIIEDNKTQNASLEGVKEDLKDRISEISRQASWKESEQHRKIAALENIDSSQDKQIKAFKGTLEKQKQKVSELESLLAFETRQSSDLEQRLLKKKKEGEKNERALRKKLQADMTKIESLKEAVEEKSRSASKLQSQLAIEATRSNQLKERFLQTKKSAVLNEQALREKLQADGAEIETLKEKLARKKRIDDLKNRKIVEAEKVNKEVINQLRGEIKAGNVVISEMKDRLTVQIVNKVLFASGSIQVSKKGKEILKNVSKALKQVKGSTIRIEGHTDDVPISAGLSEKFPSNWELSTARATQVVRYLIKEKVSPENLMAVGMSQYSPVIINDSPEGREMNRRIEIVLVPKEQ